MRVLQMLWHRTGNLDYRNQANGLIAGFASTIERRPSSYAYMLTGIEDFREGELSARGFAAQGGIRLEGSIQSLSDGKQLLSVAIEIPQAWHINSNRPKSKELIPTQLKLSDRATGWQLGPVTYPNDSMQQLAFQSEPLAVYENKIQLQALLEKSDPTANNAPLPVELTLQACNNEICLPPEQITLRISQSE
jgi:hypothetical protein